MSGGTSYLLATLNSYGHTKYTFYSGIIQNVVNLTLSFAVVKIPTLSADEVVGGIALSAGAGSLAALGMAIAVFVRKGIGLHRPRCLTDALMWTGRILRIGLPSAISSASFTISQIVTTAFVATLGDSALAAKVFYTNILSYVYLFSFNAGAANAILVGIRYGAGELHEADRMNRALTRLTMIVNLTLSVGVILLHRPLVGIFTSSEQIIALAVGVFAIDIITEQGRAVSHIYEYALRSVGDVWATLAVTLASCWIFSIGLAYLLSVRLGLGLAGCWIGLAADEATRGIFTYLRWRRKGWHSLPAISENG